MKRILLWYWGRRGGGAQFALSLARALAPGGVALSVSRENTLIDSFREVPASRQEVTTFNGIVGFGTGFLRLPALGAELRGFAQGEGADVVLSAMGHPWTPFLVPTLARARLAFIPVIHDARPHPGDPSLMFDWRLDRELAAAQAVVVLSDSVAQAIAARRPTLRLIRLPLGAHLPMGMAPTRRMADFVFFGRIRPYKGLDLLRDAWPLVRAAFPAATLHVAGEGNIDACAPGLCALPGVTVEPRWIADAEMAQVVASAGALVVPYREASQSGVVPVALALGVPVVATSVGGLAEQVRHGTAGLVVAPQASALAQAMISMLDPVFRDRLAEGARAEGVSLTDWGAIASQLRAGIEKVF